MGLSSLASGDHPPGMVLTSGDLWYSSQILLDMEGMQSLAAGGEKGFLATTAQPWPGRGQDPGVTGNLLAAAAVTGRHSLIQAGDEWVMDGWVAWGVRSYDDHHH